MQFASPSAASDEITSGPKSENHHFLDVQALLRERGLPVPLVYFADLTTGMVLLEDLGDQTLEAYLQTVPNAQWEGVYKDVVELLAFMHRACEAPDPTCIVYQRRFDAALLAWELDHFREWGLEALYGPLPADTRQELQTCFETITKRILEIPEGFCHRDFQSRNLMRTPHRSHGQVTGGPAQHQPGPWTLIDFQDALIGPRPYDLAALLCDSYLTLEPELQTLLIEHYTDTLHLDQAEKHRFIEDFWWVALQRKLKDAGRFIFIDRVRKNPAFLPYYVPSLQYVARALAHRQGLEPLKMLVSQSLERYGTLPD